MFLSLCVVDASTSVHSSHYISICQKYRCCYGGRYVIYQQLSSLFFFTGALSEDNISLRSSPSKAYKPKTSNIQEEYPAEEYPEVDSDGEILDVPDSAYVDALKSEESELTKNNSFR